MKALTAYQPHASLVAIGAKKIETRSWYTSYRGPLAIHASANYRGPGRDLPWQEPFKSALRQFWQDSGGIRLPFGSIIAVCNLVNCLQVFSNGKTSAILDDGKTTITGNEYAFGDFRAGRYAWLLENVRQVEPVPCKGRQRLWDVPGEVEEMIRVA